MFFPAPILKSLIVASGLTEFLDVLDIPDEFDVKALYTPADALYFCDGDHWYGLLCISVPLKALIYRSYFFLSSSYSSFCCY